MFARTTSAGVAATVLLLAGLPHSAVLAKPPDLPFMQRDVCLEKAGALEVHSDTVAENGPAPAVRSNAGAPARGEGTPLFGFRIDFGIGFDALRSLLRRLPSTID